MVLALKLVPLTISSSSYNNNEIMLKWQMFLSHPVQPFGFAGEELLPANLPCYQAEGTGFK